MVDRYRQLTDEQLVSIYPHGEPNARFAVLYERYVQKVYHKCLQMTCNAEDAQDFTQDIFLKVFDKLDTFQNRSTFSTWLYRISHNYCLDKLKQNERLKKEFLSDSISDQTSDEPIDTTDIPLEQMMSAIQRIPDDEIRLLTLKYEQGLSIKEIAEHFGIKDSAIKMRLKRSREKVIWMYYHPSSRL